MGASGVMYAIMCVIPTISDFLHLVTIWVPAKINIGLPIIIMVCVMTEMPNACLKL